MIRVVAAKHRGQVAQLVEHGPEKAGVGGSSPPLTTFLFLLWRFSAKKVLQIAVFTVILTVIRSIPGLKVPTFCYLSRNFPSQEYRLQRRLFTRFSRVFLANRHPIP